MMCCATLLLIVAWLQHGYRDRRGLPAGAASSSLRLPGAFLLWGAGLAGLAYLALVAVLLGSSIAVHVDGTTVCITGASAPILPVPEALVAERWLLRSLVILVPALLACAAGIVCLLGASTGGLALPRPGLVLIGGGMAWLLLTTLDHRLFGLYAVPAAPAAAAAMLHAPGLALLAGGLWHERRRRVGDDRYCPHPALRPPQSGR